MKSRFTVITAVLILPILISCSKEENESGIDIIFLHHSTGRIIYKGTSPSLVIKVAKRISPKLADKIDRRARMPVLFRKHNRRYNTSYSIEEIEFPKKEPYGWKNYPYDYYNIWVKNAGIKPYLEEPTLEMLTQDYQVIIFKHCFPVSKILPDQDTAIIDSEVKTISNYKLQYLALRDKLNEFDGTKFILFTGAALLETNLSEDEARRAKDFFKWVIDEWDLPGDNVYLWDLYNLQTEGGLYLKEEYAESSVNPHPNRLFAKKAVGLFFNRIIDVIENEGITTSLSGEKK